MRTTVSFYAVLLCVVAPLFAAAPLAWAFVVVSVWTGRIQTYTLSLKAAFVWAILEAVFSIYHRILARRVSNTPPLPPPDLITIYAGFFRVLQAGMTTLTDPDADTSPIAVQYEDLDERERGSVPRLGSPAESVVQLDFHDPRAQDFRECMRTWFHKRPWSEIHTHEMRQWIYWATFNGPLPPDAELLPVQRSLLDETLHLLQKRAGAAVKEGTNPACKPVLLTLDPVTVHFRPLMYYVLIWVVNTWVRMYFQKHYGFRYGRCGDLEYLARIPMNTSATSAPRPLVFFHGLGLGLFQYGRLLVHLLRALHSHPILIPLQPQISQSIFHRRFLNPLPREESVNSLTRIIREFGWEDGVDILSHSNGTYFHAWVLKSHPDLIKRSCFIDPVIFCSWEGDVCYNFLYRPCTTAVDLITRYFVGSELGVANTIQRHFDWSANSLWFEEIPHGSDPRKVTFFLSGRDNIVDAARVKRYLSSHGVRKGLWFDPNGRHGQALQSGDGLRRVVQWLLEVE